MSTWARRVQNVSTLPLADVYIRGVKEVLGQRVWANDDADGADAGSESR